MNSDRWKQVKQVFDSALDLDPAERHAYLDSNCGGDSDLRREVESLLAAHEDAGSRYDAPVVSGDPLIGRQMGAYRILRRLGKGGMGAVYLGARTDDQFRRLVAIKAIRPDVLDEHTSRRFQNERHMLAALEHPNIVRLLDGGATDDGVPYLVMDYVEGQPIDVYCRNRNLEVHERLELFRQLCGAVHYAHQNLVVHRDLKPANILVTPQGVPKLLDFGIAKLLRPEFALGGAGYTRTAAQPMTPEYASPEQIRGQPVTTASDVYALGVLLYTLLAGTHPFQRQTASSYELERAICETEAVRPSAEAPPEIRRLIQGDLDMIVLTAMRKEPQRRYASAEHLSEDVRRYLASEPVAARGESIIYRARKFVGRNRLGVAAAVAAIGLVGYFGASDYANRIRAARRFEELRSFANWVINDLDGAIQKIEKEGLTGARKQVVEHAVLYLDRLANEAGGDRQLQLDAISGYLKVADLEGNLYRANVGDTSAARVHAEKALSIAKKLEASSPNDPAVQAAVSDSYAKMGDFLGGDGDHAEAIDLYRRALEWKDMPPRKAWGILNNLAFSQAESQDPAAAVDTWVVTAELMSRDPDERVRQRVTAYARERIPWFKLLSGYSSDAETAIRDAIASYQQMNPPPKDILAGAYKTLAEVLKRQGRTGEAIPACRESIAIHSALDKTNNKYSQALARERMLLGELLAASGDLEGARDETASAAQFLRTAATAPSATSRDVMNYVELAVTTPLPEFAGGPDALRLAREAVQMTHRKNCEAFHLLALAEDRAGNRGDALVAEQEALKLLPSVRPGGPKSEVRQRIESSLAKLQAKSGIR